MATTIGSKMRQGGDPGFDPGAARLLEQAKERERRRLGPRERRTELTAGALFLAAAIALPLLVDAERGFEPLLAIALVIAYALAVRVQFELGSGWASPHQLVLVPMLLLLPVTLVPLLVAAARVAGAAPDLIARRRHPERALLALGDSWYALGPALVLALGGIDGVSLDDWPLFVAALAAEFAVDFPAIALRERLGLGIPVRAQLRDVAEAYSIDVLLAPLGLLLALTAHRGDEAEALLLGLPMLALLALFARERRAHVDAALALGGAYKGTTLLLAEVVENDDNYTGEHSRGVVSLALEVADELELDERQRRTVEFGALLHDVGKVAISKEIINKRGSLTDEERAVVAQHTVHGERMLARVGGVLREAGRVVRSSHERWDGAGYPDGLRAEEIPLEARIVSCCDAFNAMTTDRPYRRALPEEDALAEINRMAGSQFDPQVAVALVDVVTRERVREASGRFQRGLQALAGSEPA